MVGQIVLINIWCELEFIIFVGVTFFSLELFTYPSRVPKPKLIHTTTLFSLSEHYILSREWIVIVDQVQTNY